MFKFKKIFFILLLPFVLFGIYAIVAILYAKITYYNPEEKIILQDNKESTLISKDSFSVMIWNIGYAGLGAETNFFYDGGTMMRPPKDWSDRYLVGINNTIEKNPTDFTLIQEADIHARRSYYIDQVKYILEKNKEVHKSFALNYKVNYIPLPWTNPMGNVEAGLFTISNFNPSLSIRYQLPGSFGFPKQLFFLRRCLLVNQYLLSNGKKLILVNIHNSAYDETGALKKAENEYLKNYLTSEYAQGNYIVVGGDWNQCPPNFKYDALSKNKEGDYSQTNVDENFIPEWQWVYDTTFATNRKNDKAYHPETTFTTLIDFFLLSPNIQSCSIKGVDTKFAFSDHQPVILNFKLK